MTSQIRTKAARRADGEAWQAYPKLRWIYDRLQLSQALEYECGPAGTLPPRPGIWFVKPIINLNGMGVDAHAQMYDGGSDFPARPGNFWMPRFTGRHLSLDLKRVQNRWEVAFAVECIYRSERPYEWRKVDDRPELPILIRPEATDISWLNVETIGGNVIEVHLRRNHDFDAMPDACSAFPIWEGEPVPQDMIPNLEDADGFLVPRRLGFVYRIKENWPRARPWVPRGFRTDALAQPEIPQDKADDDDQADDVDDAVHDIASCVVERV